MIALAADGVLIAVLHAEGVGIGFFIGFEEVVIKLSPLREGVVELVLRRTEVNRSANVANFFHRHSFRQQLGDAEENLLSHAVGQDIGARVDQNRPPDLVIPVVVVGEPAQRGLQPAENDRHIAVGLADAVAVDDGSAVRPQAHLPAGGVVVIAALFLGGRVMAPPSNRCCRQ